MLNHINKQALFCKLLVVIISCFIMRNSVAFDDVFNIQVSKPTFVLPQFTGPYREREASIAPEEYETAERLKALLQNNNQAEVLQELESFYNIELSAAMLTLKAQIYFSLQKYDNAEALYLEVLSRKPQLVRVHRDLGQLYLLKNNPRKAQKHFAKAIALGSNEAIVHGQLGYLNLTLHSPFSAISEYQQAMAIEPEVIHWQQGLFSALSQAKMYSAAQALLAEMLVKNPQDIDLWVHQAVLHLNMNESKQALASLEMAILLGNKDENHLKTAIQLHLQLQSYERAFELITLHIDQTTLNVKTLNTYIQWLVQLEMWQEASELLTSIAPKISTMNKIAQSILFTQTANINNKRKKFSQADRNYQKALRLNPANGEALLKYALFASEQHKNIQAETLYIRAEALPEFEKQALLGKAQLYINTLRHKEALTHLQKAFNRYPDLHTVSEQIEVLKNIIKLNKQKNT